MATLHVWDKGCLGCRTTKTDVMIEAVTDRNNITQLYLTQEEASKLYRDLERVLLKNDSEDLTIVSDE